MFLNLTKRLLLIHFKDSKASEFVKVTFSIAELRIFCANLLILASKIKKYLIYFSLNEVFHAIFTKKR